jgi:hypothetical protein
VAARTARIRTCRCPHVQHLHLRSSHSKSGSQNIR